MFTSIDCFRHDYSQTAMYGHPCRPRRLRITLNYVTGFAIPLSTTNPNPNSKHYLTEQW